MHSIWILQNVVTHVVLNNVYRCGVDWISIPLKKGEKFIQSDQRWKNTFCPPQPQLSAISTNYFILKPRLLSLYPSDLLLPPILLLYFDIFAVIAVIWLISLSHLNNGSQILTNNLVISIHNYLLSPFYLSRIRFQ